MQTKHGPATWPKHTPAAGPSHLTQTRTISAASNQMFFGRFILRPTRIRPSSRITSITADADRTRRRYPLSSLQVRLRAPHTMSHSTIVSATHDSMSLALEGGYLLVVDSERDRQRRKECSCRSRREGEIERERKKEIKRECERGAGPQLENPWENLGTWKSSGTSKA